MPRTEEQKARHREAQRRYMENYPGRARQAVDEYQARNKEKVRERNRRHNQERRSDPEYMKKHKAWHKAWRRRNPSKLDWQFFLPHPTKAALEYWGLE